MCLQRFVPREMDPRDDEDARRVELGWEGKTASVYAEEDATRLIPRASSCGERPASSLISISKTLATVNFI